MTLRINPSTYREGKPVIEKSQWGKFSPNRDGSVTPQPCRDCGEAILWIEKPDGKKDRVNATTDKIHYYECPNGRRAQGGNSGPPTQGRGAPQQGRPQQSAGPVWTGIVELDDAQDGEWYAIRVRVPNSEARLKQGDRIKVMIQS